MGGVRWRQEEQSHPPYLYLLAAATSLPIPKLVAIKSISVLFDGLLSLLTYLILRRQVGPSLLPLCGAALMLFAPTIVINSAVFLLLLAPALIAGRSAQSLAQVYEDQVRTGGVTATAGATGGPGGHAFGGGQDAPTFDTGQPPANGVPGPGSSGAAGPGTAGSGPGSASNGNNATSGTAAPARPWMGRFGGGRGSGGGGFGFSASSLTYDAPTLYQWFPANAPAAWKWIGTLLAALGAAALVALAAVQRVRLRPEVLLRFALLAALAVPFLLPAMHERYFYLADVLSIVFACRFPRYFFVPIAMQAVSLLSYAPYLLGTPVGYLPFVSGLVLALIVAVAADLVLTLYPACPLPPPFRAARDYALGARRNATHESPAL